MSGLKSGVLLVFFLCASSSGASATPPGGKDASARESPAVVPEDAYPVRFAPEAKARGESGLGDDALVLGVVVGDEARAYPLSALWEEGKHTLNDTLADAPIAVSMCPIPGVGATYMR